MKDLTITISGRRMAADELPPARRALVERAREMTSQAYAPYSHFHVGAAIELELPDGSRVTATGANQENAALPSSLCAERTTAYWAHANYPGARMRAIAIAAALDDGTVPPEVISPCGACRQALLEYEKLAGQPVEVILAGPDDVVVLPSVKSLLPLAFTEF